MKRFNVEKTIKDIEKYWVNPYFHAGNPKKVFYSYKEWSGWRFWLKAIRNKDWKSIKKRYY